AARGRHAMSRQDVEQRALAGAVPAHDGNELAGRDVERDVSEDLGAVRDAPADMADADDGIAGRCHSGCLTSRAPPITPVRSCTASAPNVSPLTTAPFAERRQPASSTRTVSGHGDSATIV